MMKKTEIMMKVNNKFGRTILKVKKHSPEIWMGVAIASFVGSIYLGVKAGMKANEVLEKHEERLSTIEKAKYLRDEGEIDPDDYSDKDIGRDKAIAYLQTGGDFVRLFAPCAVLGAVSLASMLTSNVILKRRYLGAVTAFNTVSEAFKLYRSRVVEDVGVEKDREYLYGTHKERVTKEIVDENGKKKKVTEEQNVLDLKYDSGDYIRFFDESNPNWDKNPEYSLFFLKAKETAANSILQSRGHIFLNEVFEMLSMPHSQLGAVVGWVKGNGDDRVDFGLYDQSKVAVRRFVNGDANIIPLEFNCDGIILDKLGVMK